MTHSLFSLFEIHPRSKQAFGLRRNFDPTIENCRKQKIAIQHMCRLLRFIHLLLTMECPPELLYQTLEDCGRRHLKYNTQAQTIPLMGEAILMALQDWIGEEGWSEELQGAWSEVFDLIENRMVKGMEK